MIVEARTPMSKLWLGHTLSEGPEEKSFLDSSNFWWFQMFLGLWLDTANLYLCPHVAFSIAAFPFSFSYKDIAIGYSVHPG